jgi:hypothetical protein
MLVEAANSPQWGSQLKRVLHAAYTPLYELDLKAASPSQFVEKFTKTYPGEGSTSRKSMTFFLTAAKDAQIEVSPYIMQNKKPRSGPAKKRTPKSSGQNGAVTLPVPPPPPLMAQPIVQQLVAILDPTKMTEPEMEAVWTLVKYLRKEGK